MDRDWWARYYAQTNIFEGARYTSHHPNARHRGVAWLRPPFNHYGNSGAAAISMAHQGNAERVILLGYDCQHTDGKRHHHGDHPKGLGNAGSVHKWAERFEEQRRDFAGTEIINCSRETALTCFPRAALEDLLE